MVGLTAPLLRVGLERHVEGDVRPGLAALVVLGWAVVVVTVMNGVLPWRRLIVAGALGERQALVSAQATRREQVAYHAQWLSRASCWALGLSLPVVLVGDAALAELLGRALISGLVWGAAGALVGVLTAGSFTARLLGGRE
jgi:hypothetical protein